MKEGQDTFGNAGGLPINQTKPVPAASQTEKNNQLKIPQITLPKGGGALRSIDEKFSVNAINGTSGFHLPLPVSDARGFSPSLSISYNSGSGNGVFGLGWSLSLPSIRRKTEKELPQYFDDIDSDTYVISEAEDLVPEYKKDNTENFIKDAAGNFFVNEFDSDDGAFIIRRYRPRIEGLFARIERWTEKTKQIIHWRVISKDNVTALYGKNPQCRIADPNDSKKIFEWLIEFSYNDKGHCLLYEYKKEDGLLGIDPAKLHNKNRTNGNSLFTNTYLKRVRYGNVSPYKKHGDPLPAQWLFETVFDYGEHEITLPYAEVNTWNFRPDAFSEYRPGFEIRTCRLCKRVLLYHHFSELPGGSALIRSMDFKYINNGEEGFTFLEDITVIGFTKHDDGSYTQKSLPPFSFIYQRHEWNDEVKSISAENLVGAPSGIDEQAYQLVDLYSEGLSGILTEQGNGWFYKSNWGGGIFTPAKLVVPKPSFTGLQSGFQVMELEADGIKQIAQWQEEPKGFFELSIEEEWQPFMAFEKIPSINFSDPNLRMLDLNGDGKADVLITEDEVFTWYPSEGKKGYSASEKVIKNFDDEKGPALVFANGSQSIFLADMSGDGLTDLVQIKNGEVCYWPNLGYGKFGAKVSMDHAPTFDYPDQFNPAFIELADIDGSGTTDIIYLGKNQLTIWLNQHGNGFLPQPKIIQLFPEITNYSKVSVIDLLGSGMACIVWNCNLPKHQDRPLQYIDLLKSKKPHILISYKNNLGKEVELEYTPSTHYYIKDKLDGTPWVTKLHFPVHCVSKTIMYDRIMKTRFASEYTYHHGYYDHHEREFRGFGRVDQTDAEDITHFIKQSGSAGNNVVSEDLHQPPVQAKTWFHTGAFLDREKILNQFIHEYSQNAAVRENLLPEPELETDLSIDEWRQAFRACKGMLLRREVYANDGLPQSDKPYAVEQHNAQIKKLQPKGLQKHAVFLVHESEAITYHYERNSADSRIAHNFLLDIDPYGNVLQSASVVYPRKSPAAGNPANEPEQEELHIIFSENKFTDDLQLSLDYRSPLLHLSKSYELTGLAKPAAYYSLKGIKKACSDAMEIDYEVQPTLGSKQKRLIEFVRQQYRGDDGITVLPFGTIESKGLLHQSYKAAFNQNILSSVFNPKITLPALQAILTDPAEGAYIFEDNYFWISSGTQNYDVNHFFVSTQFTNPFGKITTIEYDNSYFLFIKKATDALGNEMKAEALNYRTLSPYLMKDMNDNVSAIRFDELGMIVKGFVIGKKGIDAGDELDDTKVEMSNAGDFPSMEIEYNLLEWYTQTQTSGFDISNYKPKPNFVKTTVRETHYHADASHATKWQKSYSYSDGGGHEVLKKVQAEPGLAWHKTASGICEEVVANKRWVGNGRIILNNKGNAVKQYEPYFSTTFEYDDESEMPCIGVTPIIHYDPLGRTIRTDFPNKTFSKVEFTPWLQKSYDANDTVKDSQWYIDRGSPDPLLPAPTIDEQRTAWLAAKHYDTPTLSHLDSLGRMFLSIADKGKLFLNAGEVVGDNEIKSKIKYDIEGNELEVIDALGRIAMVYEYDMLGNKIKQISMDAGSRWMINTVAGKPLLSWDDRRQTFSFEYDDLQRPISIKVEGGDGSTPLNHVFEKIEYVDTNGLTAPQLTTQQTLNLVGKTVTHFDTAGKVEFKEYDFKGNLKESVRTLLNDYKQSVNWASNPILETENFIFKTEFDALNRPVKIYSPHNTGIQASVITPEYNEANLLNGIKATLKGAATENIFVENIDYDAKGQREKIKYGNGTYTKYRYDEKTYRLIHLETYQGLPYKKLQDLSYTYDPVGNITHIVDEAQPTIFFNNHVAQPVHDYSYDAIYRLIAANGREHDAIINLGTTDNWNDIDFKKAYNPGDSLVVRNYTQKYEYDEVGNITKMDHNAGAGSWLRTYTYSNNNNRLLQTVVRQNNQNNIYSYDNHPQHGFITKMPHLQVMHWNFKDELQAVAQQKVVIGIPETSWYVYDASGQRVRKVTDNSVTGTNFPTKKNERIYLNGWEIYREYNGNIKTLERETLHIMDDQNRVAMVDTPNRLFNPVGEKETIHFQYSNHLGSASLELDKNANVISYEEYHPYGTTAYQAINKTIKANAKRYRYTGKERDEESGLYYHGARYYAPWFGRWLNCDPAGMIDGTNLYVFTMCNPIIFKDISGLHVDEFIVAEEIPLGKLAIGKKGPGGTELKPLPPAQKKMQTAPIDERYEADKGADRARTYANSPKQNPGGLGKPQSGDEMAHMSPARENAKSAIPNDIANAKQNIKAMPAQGKDATVFRQNGSSYQTDIHAAHEPKLDEIHGRAQAGKPQGTLASSIAAQDAMEEAKILTEPMTREYMDKVKAGGLAAPEKGPPVDPKTGRVIKAGGDALEKGGMTVLKKLGSKALKVVPFVGIGAGLYSLKAEASQGNTGTAVLEGIGLIPVIGDVVDAGRLGIAVGGVVNEFLVNKDLAMTHGDAAKSAAQKLGAGETVSDVIGGLAAAGSSVGQILRKTSPIAFLW